MQADANVYDPGTDVPVSRTTDTVMEAELLLQALTTAWPAASGRRSWTMCRRSWGCLSEPVDGSGLPADVSDLGINAGNDAAHMADLSLSFSRKGS